MRLASIAVLAAVWLIAATAAAQPPAPRPIDAAERQQAVAEAAKALRRQYIYPEVAERAATAVEMALKSGAYDGLSDRRAFADRLTADLAAVAHDKHMRVGSLSAPGPSPMGNGPPPRSEAGVVRADRLPGNIGYIEVIGFPPPAMFRGPIDRAMAALADTKALIIDVRRNGGGNPTTVSYLVSFFVDGRVHVNDLVWRNAGADTFRTQEYWTVPTPTKYLGKPVYLLTSKVTFSGGEEFSYDLQTLKRATLVGEATGGGANPGSGHRLSDDLEMFVPDGRAVNPVTKTSWEGKGVVPDIAAPAADALTAALRKLGQAPASGDVAALSQARLFEPRATAQPGAEAALRDGITGVANGAPNYDRMADQLAGQLRRNLPDVQKRLTALGPLKSVTFREIDGIGGNVYDTTFENGALRWTIFIDSDGKVAVMFFRPA